MSLFDDHATTYDEFCRTPLGHFVDEVERGIIANLAMPRLGERAIDLGCGTGSYTMWLENLGLPVTGVDISQGMLAVARSKTGNTATFVEADLSHLPFPDASFDLAVCNVTLEFTANPGAIVMEAHRVLRPGGRLIIGFIGKLGPWGQKYSERGRRDTSSVYHHARFFSSEEASRLGWTDPSRVQFGLFVAPEEFLDEPSAWMVEREKVNWPDESKAGFFAIRWDKPTA